MAYQKKLSHALLATGTATAGLANGQRPPWWPSAKPIGICELLGISKFPQLFFDVAGRKYLDALQATEVIRINDSPVSRLNLNRVPMAHAYHIRLNDIQLA